MDATEHAAAPELVSDSGASADEAGLVAEEPVSLDAIAHHGALIAQQLLADELAPLLGDTLAQLKGLTDKLAGLRQAVDAKCALAICFTAHVRARRAAQTGGLGRGRAAAQAHARHVVSRRAVGHVVVIAFFTSFLFFLKI